MLYDIFRGRNRLTLATRHVAAYFLAIDIKITKFTIIIIVAYVEIHKIQL